MLEGTLESFTLPDIFQLLAFTKKTGCLKLRQEPEQGRVYFEDGQVYYAVSSSGRLALGRRLVGAGLVATEQLRGALDRQRAAREHGRGLRIGRMLVELGAIDEDTLETFVREQIQDAVFDLMRWADGSFSFDMETADARADEPIQLTVSVENLIMEGSRRLEEWEQVRRKIPSMDAIVAMAPLAGDGAVEVSLKPDEWRVLTVVDGRRTVQELVELFGQGEFHTCKTLYGMVGAGLLEIREPGTEGASSISDLLAQRELLSELEVDSPTRDRTTEPAEEEPAADEPVDDEPMESEAADEEPVGEPLEAAAAATEPDGEEPQVADEADPDDVPDHEDVAALVVEVETADAGQPPNGTPSAAAEVEREQPRLTTDPAISADLVRRLIDGVKGL